MRTLLSVVIAVSPVATLAAFPTDMQCLEGKVRHIDPRTLEHREYEGSSTYVFRDGKLFIAAADRPEYLYGSLAQPEPGRFVVGHKTIYFLPSQSGKQVAHLTHVYKDEVRVSTATCAKS